MVRRRSAVQICSTALSMYVYAIYNRKADKFYIGQTKDLNQRLEYHNGTEFKKSYTSRFDGSWELVYKEECANREVALKREKQLKSFRGREFIKSHLNSVGRVPLS